MTKIHFIEAGSGDPSHRYENARLGFMLHRLAEEDFISIDPMNQPGHPHIGRGRLGLDTEDPGILLGARCFHGYRLTAENDQFDLPSLDMTRLGEPRRGAQVRTVAHNDVPEIVNDLFARGMVVGIHDADFPDQRYKVLSGPHPVTPEYVRSGLSIRDGDGVVPVNLIAWPKTAICDRRFIFVDGGLVTDTPVAFNLELWRENAIRSGINTDTVHAAGAYGIAENRPAEVTEMQREFAEQIASELGLVSGYVDVASCGSDPWLTAAHQSHVGDFSLYGADIGLIAEATIDHIKRLEMELVRAPHL